jgi:hypothetical protein
LVRQSSFALAIGEHADHRGEIAAHSAAVTFARSVRVRHLEALDGTPIIDIKPILSGDIGRR